MQTDIFHVTHTPGQAARDEALRRFDGSEWKEYLMTLIARISDVPTGITADDVWGHLDSIPQNRNCIGAAFRHAALRGIIEPIGYRQSKRRESHARVLRVWRKVR